MNFTSNCLRAFEPCDSATPLRAALWHIFHSNAHAYRLYIFNEPPRLASLFLFAPLRSAKPCIVAQLFAPQQVFLLAASLFLFAAPLRLLSCSALRCDQRSPAVYASFWCLVEPSRKNFQIGSLSGSWRTRSPVSAAQALAKAGATGGTPGSPTPAGAAADRSI